MVYRAFLLALGLPAAVISYPGNWDGLSTTSTCYVPPGASSPRGIMWSGEMTSLNATLSLVPDHGAFYQPGAEYAVTVRYPGWFALAGMLGSSAGSWANDDCASGLGVLTNTGIWTAPASGSVTIGGTVARGTGNNNIQTSEMVLTTPPPTPSPTPAPSTSPSTSPSLGPSVSPSASPSTSPTPPPTPPPVANEISFTGFLSDTVCIGIINSVDGTNVTTDAPAHTVQCLLQQYCIDSGFTVMDEVGGFYKAKYQLDATGVTLAVDALRQLSLDGVVNNVQFTVTGVPGAAATYDNSDIYNGQPLGVQLVTSAVVAETPGPEIASRADVDSSSGGEDVAEEIEVAGGIVIALVIVATLVALTIFEKKGRKADTGSSRQGMESGTYQDVDANTSTTDTDAHSTDGTPPFAPSLQLASPTLGRTHDNAEI